MKLITITEQIQNKILKKISEELKSAKLTNGKFTYTYDVDCEQKDNTVTKAVLSFSPKAWIKQSQLIKDFDTEVAWHGFIYRDAEDDNRFYIDDIIVYPQTVSGSTVNTDQEQYEKWTFNIEDELFNAMHYQAHSHVNMETYPSGVDLKHQQQIISQLQNDDFYVFMILNKKGKCNAKIYDYKQNKLFETQDIDVQIQGIGKIEDFIKESKDLVKSRTYNKDSSNTKQYALGKAIVESINKKNEENEEDNDLLKESDWFSKHYDEQIDFDDFIFGK